jgi:hypothetical protein
MAQEPFDHAVPGDCLRTIVTGVPEGSRNGSSSGEAVHAIRESRRLRIADESVHVVFDELERSA